MRALENPLVVISSYNDILFLMILKVNLKGSQNLCASDTTGITSFSIISQIQIHTLCKKASQGKQVLKYDGYFCELISKVQFLTLLPATCVSSLLHPCKSVSSPAKGNTVILTSQKPEDSDWHIKVS
jgi:hypothetical protein